MNENNKNKGFSLIELVVTIAVMGIVVLISVNIFGMIRSADVKSASGNIDSMLSSMRSKSLGKANDFKMCIEKNGNESCVASVQEKRVKTEPDGSTVEEWVVIESEKLGSDVVVTGSDGEGTWAEMESGCVIEIQCSKSDGRFITSKFKKEDGSEFDIKRIDVTKGDNSRSVKLVLSTGRHYID